MRRAPRLAGLGLFERLTLEVLAGTGSKSQGRCRAERTKDENGMFIPQQITDCKAARKARGGAA